MENQIQLQLHQFFIINYNYVHLGVTFDQQLSFGTNASKVVAAANSTLGLINRHFRHIETKPFMNLYKTLVRPKVEYWMTVAQPVYKKDKEKIERVQHRATKLVLGMENKGYSERLEELKLPSLEYRRKRADVMQTYKIMNNIDKIDEKKFFKPCKEVRTRGHPMTNESAENAMQEPCLGTWTFFSNWFYIVANVTAGCILRRHRQ